MFIMVKVSLSLEKKKLFSRISAQQFVAVLKNEAVS